MLVDGVGPDFTLAGFARNIRRVKAAAADETHPIPTSDGSFLMDR